MRVRCADQAVVLRIEPLRVSTLSGFHPSRELGQAGCAGRMPMAAHPVTGDRVLAEGRREYTTAL